MLDYTDTWNVHFMITDEDGNPKDMIEGNIRQPTVGEAVRVLESSGILIDYHQGYRKRRGGDKDNNDEYDSASRSLREVARGWVGDELWDDLGRMPPEDLCVGLASMIGQMARWHMEDENAPKQGGEGQESGGEDEDRDDERESDKMWNSGVRLERSAYFYAAALGLAAREVFDMPIGSFDEAAKQEFRREAHEQLSLIQAVSYPHVEDKQERKDIIKRLSDAVETGELGRMPDNRPRWERVGMTFKEFQESERERVSQWKENLRKIRAKNSQKRRDNREKEEGNIDAQ